MPKDQAEPSHFMTRATAYDVVRGQCVGSITADKIPPDYSPNKMHFYCTECLNQDHAMRLAPRPEDRTGVLITPPRFVHYRYADATHHCDHPVRYRKLDELAERYNAKKIDKNSYVFQIDLDQDVVLERRDREVDQASRIAKIIETILYDKGLSDRQFLELGGARQVFHDAVFDTSPQDKLRLFRQTYEAAKAERDFYAAMIFRPIGHRGVWKDFRQWNAIPGIAGKKVEFNGVSFKPSAVLRCADDGVYQGVREIIDRKGTQVSSAVIVHGKMSFNLQKMFERSKTVTDGQDMIRGLFSVFDVRSVDQVSPWDEDFISFDQAQSHQEEVQKKIRREFPKLFEKQMGLAL